MDSIIFKNFRRKMVDFLYQDKDKDHIFNLSEDKLRIKKHYEVSLYKKLKEGVDLRVLSLIEQIPLSDLILLKLEIMAQRLGSEFIPFDFVGLYAEIIQRVFFSYFFVYQRNEYEMLKEMRYLKVFEEYIDSYIQRMKKIYRKKDKSIILKKRRNKNKCSECYNSFMLGDIGYSVLPIQMRRTIIKKLVSFDKVFNKNFEDFKFLKKDKKISNYDLYNKVSNKETVNITKMKKEANKGKLFVLNKKGRKNVKNKYYHRKGC